MSKDKSHVEAWKAIIDFSKVTISFSASILSVLISYFVLKKVDIYIVNFIAPVLLVLSIIASLLGFGRAIKSIKTGDSEKSSILFCNIGALLLTLAILSIGLIKIGTNNTVDDVLDEIKNTTTTLEYKLVPGQCSSFKIENEKYLFTFETDKGVVKVSYSTKEQRIISIQ